jgi:hypothetical protein
MRAIIYLEGLAFVGSSCWKIVSQACIKEQYTINAPVELFFSLQEITAIGEQERVV